MKIISKIDIKITNYFVILKRKIILKFSCIQFIIYLLSTLTINIWLFLKVLSLNDEDLPTISNYTISINIRLLIKSAKHGIFHAMWRQIFFLFCLLYGHITNNLNTTNTKLFYLENFDYYCTNDNFYLSIFYIHINWWDMEIFNSWSVDNDSNLNDE